MKGKHKTFRLVEEHLTFLKAREKLGTDQKALDFLLKAYWDVWHVAPNPFSIEKQMGQMQQQPTAKQSTVLLKTLAEYAAEKREIESPEQYKKWLTELKADQNYSDKQKELIIKYN